MAELCLLRRCTYLCTAPTPHGHPRTPHNAATSARPHTALPAEAPAHAQIFTKRYKKGVWDVRAMVDSGGMPSSHSSLCAGITTAVALQQGFGSPLFAACLCFSVIVMYDAMGVRRHAGKQAEVLNKVRGH